jgi:hypothetical protein
VEGIAGDSGRRNGKLHSDREKNWAAKVGASGCPSVRGKLAGDSHPVSSGG